ncbi:MAG: response regulator transcription factor [Gaiellales bacterium]
MLPPPGYVDLTRVSSPHELSPTVLVVDDHTDLRAALCDVLLEEGYAVREAEDGECALQEFSQRRFDAAIVDVRMPRLDGFGLLELMRERGIRYPVVLTSVVADACARSRGAELGVAAFHQKPFSLGELLTDLEQAIAAGRGRAGAAHGRIGRDDR